MFKHPDKDNLGTAQVHTKLYVIPCRWLENLRQTLLSQMGVIRSGNKSDLLNCLEDIAPLNESISNSTLNVSCTVLDDAAIVNML